MCISATSSEGFLVIHAETGSDVHAIPSPMATGSYTSNKFRRHEINAPMPKEGVKTTPSCGLLRIIFLSYADTTDICCVSVPKHQGHFLTYYTPLYLDRSGLSGPGTYRIIPINLPGVVV